MKVAWAVAVGAVLSAALPFTNASVADARIVLVPIVANLDRPVYVTHARDGSGRLFIVEQPGRIKVLHAGSLTPSVFLELASRVLSSGNEQGLLGLAFHPSFKDNGRFFVSYTRRADGATVVAEYHVSASDPDRADPLEVEILTIAQPFPNHNGGMIEFGPDGFLYIGRGDGGSGNDPANRAQDIQMLLGKLLRIDVDHPDGGLRYSSPSSNPFFGAVPGRDEIFAFGFRNPWRFSFDRATGALYLGDVGQDHFEEVDLVTPGGNFGWRVFEGFQCTGLDPARCAAPGFTPPIVAYTHIGGRCSITGGYAYRGLKGTLLSGTYVYADFCTGEIFMLQGSVQSLLLAAGMNIASFGEDGAGELYVVDLGGLSSGAVYRIVNPDAVQIGVGLGRTTVSPGQTLTIDVSESNPGPATVVDKYLGLLLPPALGPTVGCPSNDPVAFVADGGARVVVSCLSTPAFPAFARNVTVPGGVSAPATSRLFTAQWPAGVPPGTYAPFVAYTVPGGTTAFDVIAIGGATLTVVP